MDVGQQLIWTIPFGNFHGQVILSCLIVLSLIIAFRFLLKRKQPAVEILFRFILGITENQHSGSQRVPLLGRIFLFIFISNWSGALIPWNLITLPGSLAKLGAPTNDINTTRALALIRSFCAGIVFFCVSFKIFFVQKHKNILKLGIAS